MVPWTRFPALFWFQLVTMDLLFGLLLTFFGLWLFSAGDYVCSPQPGH